MSSRYLMNNLPINGNCIVRTKDGFMVGRISELEQFKSMLFRIQTVMFGDMDHEESLEEIQSILDEAKKDVSDELPRN